MRKIIIIILCLFISQLFIYPFGKNKVNYEQTNWKILKTVHFNIYYPEGMEKLALHTAKLSEEGYIHIANYLRHELTNDVPIVVYPSHAAFQNNNIIPQFIGEGTGGFTESIKNRVVIPFTGSEKEFRHVLTHELVHAFQFNILFNDTSGDVGSRLAMLRIPLWLIEGMAEYLSLGFDEGTDMFMRDLVFSNRFASIQDLTQFKIPNIYMIYKEGQSFYYFIETKYGKEAIGEIFRDLRDIGDYEKVLKIHTGQSVSRLNTEWERFYKRKYYPLIKNLNYDDDEGKQLTDHTKTLSSINVFPAVSPDGIKIAYLTNKDIYVKLVIEDIPDKPDKEKKIVTLVKGNSGAQFEGMLVRRNNLTWSRDSRSLAFIAQTNGRDNIYIVDPKNGSMKNVIRLPFRSIMDPSLSEKGDMIAFVGVGNLSSDIYIYHIHKKELQRITDNKAFQRHPKILPGGENLLYSSKNIITEKGAKKDFDIVRINIKTKEKTVLIKTKGNDIHGDSSSDGEMLVFSSNKSGIYNAYTFNIKTKKIEKITNVLSGVFNPRWYPNKKKIAFVSYQNIGYDIFIKDLTNVDPYPDSEEEDTSFDETVFPSVILNENQYKFEDFSSGLSPDFLMIGATAAINYGIVGFAQMALSDYLGNHRIIFTTNYFRQDNQNEFNFDLAYYYLKNRWDIGIGAFRQKNPFWIYSISDINDLIQNVHYGTLHMDNYGGYVIAQYPFSRFFKFSVKTSISRYERDYDITDPRNDVFANLNQVSIGLGYDNVLWGRLVPLDGFRGKISFDQSFNLTGHDLSFSSISIDLRRYFLVNKRHVFAFRLMGGKTFGPDGNNFNYFLGGFNTLRGHSLFDYSGQNMFLLNAEFRFTLVERIQLGWPLYLGIGKIGGVLFVDMGAAWDGRFVFLDTNRGRFGDFKTDIGFGLRMVLYPLLILKLDFAWPYDKKSFGKNDIIFSIGFEY